MFRNGVVTKINNDIKYLGAHIRAAGQGTHELRIKTGRMWDVAKKLKNVFRKARINNKWRFTTTCAMLESIMFYSLDTVYLTPSNRIKLDGTQIALYRYILKIPT